MNLYNRSTTNVLYFIQLPPPLHGVSYINTLVFESNLINRDINKSLLKINFSKSIADIDKLSSCKVFIFIALQVRLIYRIVRYRPDFVYFTIVPKRNSFFRDVFFVCIIKCFRVKIIYHLHQKGIGNFINNRKWLKRIYKFVFSNSSIIFLSNNLLKFDSGYLSFDNSRAFIVENAVRNTFVPDFQNKNDMINLLYLSHIQESKGIFILLEALSKISKSLNILLHIVGEANPCKIMKRVENAITKYKLETRIVLHGQLSGERKYKILSKSDILIHPTLNDAFPLDILEAMQFQLPVISTFEGAIPEIVDDGKTGFLVEKGDVKDLSRKIELLIKDKELRKQMGQNGRKKFLERYTLDMFEKNMKKVFDEIMNIHGN